jgi:divalent metal cation (Fe/Co/Zn/Cd) transporter
MPVLKPAALYIGYNSIEVLFQPIPKAHVVAFIAAIVSLIWKQVLYIYTIQIGKQVNSKGLISTAHDHLADVYGSLAAVIGIGLGLILASLPSFVQRSFSFYFSNNPYRDHSQRQPYYTEDNDETNDRNIH